MKSFFLIVLAFSLSVVVNVSAQTGITAQEASYLSSAPGLSRNINSTLPVYAIPGVADAANGSASYTIPIDIPDGIAGLQPSISVAYNSSTGNGLLGWGWNLSAGSVISRTGKNHLFEDRLSPVKFTNNDRLLLDGQRLVLYSGTSLASGSEYRTAVQSNQRVKTE